MLRRSAVRRSTISAAVLALILVGTDPRSASSDTFEYVDRQGATQTLDAELVGEGQGALALMAANGQMKLIPQGAIRKRTPGEPPTPMTCKEVAEELKTRFDPTRLRTYVQEPFVIAVILQEPLERRDEARTAAFLKTTAKFMRNVNNVFMTYAKQVRFPTIPPKFPMVALVFESDDDFNEYATKATGGRGLSAGNIAGFYSNTTNDLVLRLRECHTFETPLHEAIHQQVHNRGVLQRMAPTPVWFNEGIATGFEGNAQRINIGPTKIAKRYARIARNSGRVDWDTIVSEDSAFRGDILAGEAYGNAWGLHWLLVTQHKVQYMNYVKQLAQIPPLAEVSPARRKEMMEDSFGVTASELQTEFRQALETGLKRQRVNLDAKPPAGFARREIDMAEIAVNAVSTNGVLQVEGEMKNISPIRSRAFHVAVVTGAGTYANWIFPNVPVNKTVRLQRQVVKKFLPGARGGSAGTFQIHVHSVPVGSREISGWAKNPPIQK